MLHEPRESVFRHDMAGTKTRISINHASANHITASTRNTHVTAVQPRISRGHGQTKGRSQHFLRTCNNIFRSKASSFHSWFHYAAETEWSSRQNITCILKGRKKTKPARITEIMKTRYTRHDFKLKKIYVIDLTSSFRVKVYSNNYQQNFFK